MKFTRSISVDLFLTKQHQQKYSRHLDKIYEIKQHRDNHQKTIEQLKHISMKMKKARDRARSFKQKQDNYFRGQMDNKMFKNIEEYHGDPHIPHLNSPKFKNSHQQQHLKSRIDNIGKNIQKLHNQKPITSIRQYLVQEQNKKLAENIKSFNVNSKNYKKKLVTEVNDYLKLREHMQRFKTNLDHSTSQNKILKGQRSRKSIKTERSAKTLKTERSTKTLKTKKQKQSPNTQREKLFKETLLDGSEIKHRSELKKKQKSKKVKGLAINLNTKASKALSNFNIESRISNQNQKQEDGDKEIDYQIK